MSKAHMLRPFLASFLVAAIGLTLAFIWAGSEGLVLALLLVALEIGFSFDNAVVNATVLQGMDAVWCKRFLTWGMVISVFGMYYLCPILIVSVATGMSLPAATMLAFEHPAEYGARIQESHTQISAFGGMFLLMVFFCFMFDAGKKLHWIRPLEMRLARLGRLESIEAGLALLILLILAAFLPPEERVHALAAGVGGVALHIVVRALTALLSPVCAADGHGASAARAGLAGFVYLQMLDASFSLDAVVGAFALSTDIVLIMLGLTIGAMFVRSLTLHLVHQGTLARYVFLEHGAYYAIGALAAIMLIDTVYPVPEVVTGLIGVAVIGLSFVSSVRHHRTHTVS